MPDCSRKLIYENPLASESDVSGFVMEGSAEVSFPCGRMRLSNTLSPELGQKANFVYWCGENFPSDLEISWDFYPINEPGLAMFFFSAAGRSGVDIFDPSLQTRTGEYDLYHHGDIDAFHVSYFRRMWESERAFHTCNLRKSYGFHLVAQGADPIPDVDDCASPYRICLIKYKNEISFFINDLNIFRWSDDGQNYGKLLGGGKAGFRQMAPLVAEYANLKVYELV